MKLLDFLLAGTFFLSIVSSSRCHAWNSKESQDIFVKYKQFWFNRKLKEASSPSVINDRDESFVQPDGGSRRGGVGNHHQMDLQAWDKLHPKPPERVLSHRFSVCACAELKKCREVKPQKGKLFTSETQLLPDVAGMGKTRLKSSLISEFFTKKSVAVGDSSISMPSRGDNNALSTPRDSNVDSISAGSKRAHEDIERDQSHVLENATLDQIPDGIRNNLDIDLSNLPADPGLRRRISDYNPNVQDMIRGAYLLKGPCQPTKSSLPAKKPTSSHQFIHVWFQEFGDWLEYSITKDAVFCLHCYLFNSSNGSQGGGDAFTHKGFTNWKKKNKLRIHIGGPNSAHNVAYRKGQVLLNQKQHLETFFSTKTDKEKHDYRVHLQASVDTVRLLLQQGLAFRGCDESEKSNNRGNFLAVLQLLADHNEDINNVVLSNAPSNFKLTCPKVQKDIVNAFAHETTIIILDDLGDSLFSILIDESRDISIKEQMDVVIRYVDKFGCVIERFLSIVHVKETTAVALKEEIESLLSKHSLSITSLRGQGYDGASNMRGHLNGLKTFILKENASTFYVHCFAHQLQLALVALAKSESDIVLLFNSVSTVVNIAGASCKRRDILRDKQATKIAEALNMGELVTGKGLNQETTLKISGDTRWSSHYEALMNLILMYSSAVDVIEDVIEDGMSSEQRGEASALLGSIQSFDFIFELHLMKGLLGITNTLSKALQRKDQDIVNAIDLVAITKTQLQALRDYGWDSLLDEVTRFCLKHNVEVPKMEERYIPSWKSRRKAHEISNLHHYRVQLFIKVVDLHCEELDDRFDEVNTDLLLCVACLSPNELFFAFNKSKLIRLARLYPTDFSEAEVMILENELETYIVDMRSSKEFLMVKGISDLAKKMVLTKKSIAYPLVFKLLTLALILPVATATVERAFSAMRIIKIVCVIGWVMN